jgi:rubrerythrin
MMLAKTMDNLKGDNVTTLVQLLFSAVDMEEQFSNSVYHNYLDPADWPANFKKEVFERIRERLIVLIEDSKKHQDVLRELGRRYNSGKRDTNSIIREFKLMKRFALSAKEFYAKLCSHPQIEEENVRKTFRSLADTQQRHAEIVQEIIELVNNQ